MKISLFVALFLTLTSVASPSDEGPRLLVHILSYIGADYPGAVENGKVVSQPEYDEQLSFVTRALETASTHPDLKNNQEILSGLRNLDRKILEKAPGAEVEAAAYGVRDKILAMGKFHIGPSRLPDLVRGKKSFEASCAQCHGVTGHGDGPAGGNLDPKPTDFHSEKMDNLPPFQMFNTIRLGVPGTGMAAFTQISDEETWDLAFYIASLKPGIKNPAILFAKVKLQEALVDYMGGNAESAKNKAVVAYLEGIEPIEPKLRSRDGALVFRLEEKLAEFRKHLANNAPVEALKTTIGEANEILSKAEKRLAQDEGDPFWLTFGLAFGILLREAFEATLLLVTLLGVIRSLKIPKAASYVHGGWILAVLVGIAAWFLSGWLINLSGADRETLEGTISIVAVGVLLYVGFWLHQKTEIGKWHAFINDLVKKAVNRKNLLILGGVAFMGVFREAFETVLFLRALVLEAGDNRAVLTGVLSSSVIVLVFSWIAVRTSMRLPIRQLFLVSSFLMLLLAFILMGQAVHAFQETGLLPVTLIPVDFRAEILGIYPTMEGLIPQLILVLGTSILWFFGRTSRDVHPA